MGHMVHIIKLRTGNAYGFIYPVLRGVYASEYLNWYTWDRYIGQSVPSVYQMLHVYQSDKSGPAPILVLKKVVILGLSVGVFNINREINLPAYCYSSHSYTRLSIKCLSRSPWCCANNMVDLESFCWGLDYII
jgi:hypothetical protein